MTAPRPPGVFVNGRPAIRLGDAVLCANQFPDAVAEGAAQVIARGLPLSSVGNKSTHPAVIIEGSPDVNVGGSVFALPPNVVIEGTGSFQSKVLRDLWLLSTTPTGKDILKEIGSRKGQVLIVDASQDGVEGKPGETTNVTQVDGDSSVIRYDADRPRVTATENPDGTSKAIMSPPQVNLGHELVHAMHASKGDPVVDPTSAKSQRDLEEERARGEGIRNQDDPLNENGIRRDLGLPPRQGGFADGAYTVDEFKSRPGGDQPIDGPEDLRPE